MNMIGYVYKFIHRETKKWYIGSHNGKKPKYEGSGLLFQRAKRKYGIESFDKHILYEGEEYRKEEERILKELDAANDPMSYNMKNEALGGTFFGKANGMFGKKHSDSAKNLIGASFRGKKRPEHAENMKGPGNPMWGKSDHAHGIIKFSKENRGKTVEQIHGENKGREIRENLSKAHTGIHHNLKILTCPHCSLVGSGPNMTRYHFDKCKELLLTEEDKLKRDVLNAQYEELRTLGYKRPKQSLAIRGEKNGMFNKTHTTKACENISKKQLGRVAHNKSDTRCPICNKQASPCIIKKYHGTGKKNCK